ncbi:hypothetical protein [Streptomyces sp. 351MFTsu5.1]|uniref:hypothetical protein n=1 Tax=Streptomyces sp. 351MFTsu5.1 TaxID=1172180 RepID=UPI001F20223E|nr:hypothetical protein [Streptomyces sp. 351MFTsu5.1]
MTTVFGVHAQAPQANTALDLQSVIKVRGADPVYVARGSSGDGTASGLATDFTLYEDQAGHKPLCTVAPQGADGRLTVTAPDGSVLAVLHQPNGRRYELELPDGTHLIGRVGTVPGWFVYVLLSPLTLLYTAASLIGGYGVDWHLPSRTVWRSGSGPAPLTFSGITDKYELRPSALDPRVAYAQAVLHFWST